MTTTPDREISTFVSIRRTAIMLFCAVLLWTGIALALLYIVFSFVWSYGSSPMWAYDYLVPLFSAAIAGFIIGVSFAQIANSRQLTIVWGLASIPVTLLFWAFYFMYDSFYLITLFAAPLLGTISAIRGARLRQERKSRHLVWLVAILLILIIAYTAIHYIAFAAPYRWISWLL